MPTNTQLQRRPQPLTRYAPPPPIEATVTHEVRVVHEVEDNRAYHRALAFVFAVCILALIVVMAFEIGYMAGLAAG